jgi:hypothetical protein
VSPPIEVAERDGIEGLVPPEPVNVPIAAMALRSASGNPATGTGSPVLLYATTTLRVVT